MSQTNLGAMFKLFSLAFEPPTLDLAKLIVSGSLKEDMKAIWDDMGLPQRSMHSFDAELEAYIGQDEKETLHEIRREFTRLFMGDKPRIANSEGMWRMGAENRRAVLIINSYSLEVADFMRQCGVVRAKEYNDCLDYIEAECDFASFLASSPAYLEELGKSPLDLLEIFIDEHMKQWIPGFCAEVLEISSVVYYRALSELMSVFLKEL